MATKVIMPQLGESVVEGTINMWLKEEGDSIDEYEPLLEVGSDKVDTEVPSPAAGTILKIFVPAGETVNTGTVLAVIGEPGEEVEGVAAPVDVQAAPQAATAAPVPTSTQRESNGGSSIKRPSGPRISPVVARIAAEHSVDLNRIAGTGRDGRVTKKDILAYVEQRGTVGEPAPAEVAPWEQPADGDLFKPTDHMYQPQQAEAPRDHVHQAPPPAGQPGEVVPLTKMRRLIADHMVLSKLQTAPHVTTVFEADMSAVNAHRQKNLEDYRARGVNLTFTAYFVTAVAEALKLHPLVNSRWQDDGIYLHRDINIGMAAATDTGLIVPVIKRVDELSLAGLSRQINDLAQRARASTLSPDDVSAGTFTITNHGVSGSLFATPIINQPQTAILGVGKIQKRVVVTDDDAIAIRPMVYLTLTFDHRVLDGAGADWFMADVVRLLENWQ